MIRKGGNYRLIDVTYRDTLALEPCPEMGNGLLIIADAQGRVPC